MHILYTFEYVCNSTLWCCSLLHPVAHATDPSTQRADCGNWGKERRHVSRSWFSMVKVDFDEQFLGLTYAVRSFLLSPSSSPDVLLRGEHALTVGTGNELKIRKATFAWSALRWADHAANPKNRPAHETPNQEEEMVCFCDPGSAARRAYFRVPIEN